MFQFGMRTAESSEPYKLPLMQGRATVAYLLVCTVQVYMNHLMLVGMVY